MVALSANAQAGYSAAGSASARLPPSVPRLRMAGCAMCGTACARSGACATTISERWISACVASAAMRSPAGRRAMPRRSLRPEMGSLGKDVAKGLSEELGLKVQHHEMLDHLANRARVRKSHVISFLEGTQGIFERLTIDNLKLRILTADEIMSASEANEGMI